MFYNYLITAWRNIVKNGIFSAINIFGLAIGLMSCILIMLFVKAETGFDKWLPNADRLVRVHTAYTMPNQQPFLTVRSAGRMMEAIKGYAQAEIEDGVRLIQWTLTVRKDQDAFSEAMTMADPSFFDMFELPFAHGSVETSFNAPMNLVVTESLAIKYFGRTDVIGETLTVCCVGPNPNEVEITGVIKDLPDQTHLDINMLFYLQPALFGENDNVLHTWTSVNVFTYFKLKPMIELAQVQERVNYWLNNESPLVEMMKGFLGDKAEGKEVTDFLNLKLMSVPDLHLKAKEDAGNMGDMTPMGDNGMINTFVTVAILVLIIACINFMNLSTAKASKRAKEVAMRKVLGASRIQVAIQFLSEAIVLVLIALLLAIAAAEVALPFYNEVISRNLELMIFDDPSMLMWLILIATGVGFIAGIYPAVYLSGFMPGRILKASKSSESSGSVKLRNALVVFQFSTSIVLVICTLVVYGQTLYSNSIDVGYQSDDKLVLSINGARDLQPSLKQELSQIPGVTSVTFSSEAPTQDFENNTQYTLLETDEQGNKVEPILLNYHHMGYGFFDEYGVKPLAGRLFDEQYGTDTLVTSSDENTTVNANIIINESAMRKFGFSQPNNIIGKTLGNGNQVLTIVGVIPDIHFRSIKFGIRATVYQLNPDRFRVANIRFDTNDTSRLMSDIEQVWKRTVPGEPMSLQFLSEMMAAQYQDEMTTAQLFLAFSILAIVIACLGLYGLSAFTVERRTKEIGIRKVMGAEITDIVRLLLWQFSKPVVLANIIAWPIATYAMLQWLEAFPYRIDAIWFGPICLGVGGVSLVIAWLTVGGNAANVARKNPVKTLRYE